MGELFGALDQPHAQFLLRVVLGGLLLLAGLSKLADRRAFREAIAEYQLLPASLERPFAAFVPVAETALGTLLLVGLATTAAAALAAPLLASFAIAIGVNMARGRSFDCHCFGNVQADRIGWPALIRAALLVLVALTVAVGTSSFGALDGALWASEDGLPSVSQLVPLAFVAFAIFDVLILLPEALSFREAVTAAFRVRITGAHDHGPRPITITSNGRNGG